ncbi:MAG: antibiotic biosynthesis monooxygenase, partial [Acidobacteriota bacterium]|nr:antibiotic biosynthesis monooxygenase [Acidobacteriota bacterium]
MLLRTAQWACLLLLLAALPPLAPAQDPGPKLYVVTHVDIAGQALAAEASILLEQFATDSVKDPGSVRFELLREPNRINHFTIVEVWQNRQAFETHLALPHTK